MVKFAKGLILEDPLNTNLERFQLQNYNRKLLKHRMAYRGRMRKVKSHKVFAQVILLRVLPNIYYHYYRKLQSQCDQVVKVSGDYVKVMSSISF